MIHKLWMLVDEMTLDSFITAILGVRALTVEVNAVAQLAAVSNVFSADAGGGGCGGGWIDVMSWRRSGLVGQIHCW